MATDTRCLNADILSTILLGENEEFAKEIIRLANDLNVVKAFSKNGKAPTLEKITNMKIKSMVNARILMGEAGNSAKMNLMKLLAKEGDTIGSGIRLLEIIDNISLDRLKGYTSLMEANGLLNGKSVYDAMQGLKESVSNIIAARKGLKENYATKVFNKKIPKEERRAVLGRWYADEYYKVKNGGTPYNLVSPDEQWRAIVEQTKGKKASEREKLFNNYLLARVFLGEEEDALKEMSLVIKKYDNTMPSISIEEVEAIDNLNEAINRVYTNIADIMNDRKLREALREKITYLVNKEGADTMDIDAFRTAYSLINTTRFLEAGSNFTTILKYDTVGKAVRGVLVDNEGLSRISADTNSKKIFDALLKLLKDDKAIKNMDKGAEFLGTKISKEELIKILYTISWDESLKRELAAADAISEDILVKYARTKLFGLTDNTAEVNMRNLIKSFDKEYNMDEISTIAFKATSGVPVKVEDQSNLVFLSFEKENAAINTVSDNSVYMARAKFNDALADANTVTVTTNPIRTYDISDGIDMIGPDFDKNVEYIIIENRNKASHPQLKRLKERLDKAGNKKYKIIFPRSRQSGKYFIDPSDGKLKYRTTSKRLYNEISDRIAIDSFNSATVNLTENNATNREIINQNAKQAKKQVNDAAIAFFRSYTGLGDDVPDEKVLSVVSDLTGVPVRFDAADSVEQWELAQTQLFQHYHVSGKYTKEIKTETEIKEIIDEVNSYTAKDVETVLKKMGQIYSKESIDKNLEAIKQALINMRTTDDVTDYIWNKGVIIGLSNRGDAKDIKLSQLRDVLASSSPRDEIAKILYGDRVLEEYEIAAVDSYLDDIYTAVTNDFIHRLTLDGYQLPLVPVRDTLINYLKGRIELSDEFIQAFLFKNNIEDDVNVVRNLFDTHLGEDVSVKTINADTLAGLRRENPSGVVVRELTADEQMLPTTYNSYKAVMGNLPDLGVTYVREWDVIDREGVMNILKRFFTEDELKEVNINFIDDLVEGIGEGKYSRDGMKRALDFVNNPEEVTPYHEAVHMYLDMFVGKEEKEKLFNNVYKKNKKTIQEFIKARGYEPENIYEATEEWVAEMFIRFVKGKDEELKIAKETRNWFQKLWDKIKSIFSSKSYEQLNDLNNLYNNIYNKARPEGGIVNRGDASSAFRRRQREPFIEYRDNTLKLLEGRELLNRISSLIDEDKLGMPDEYLEKLFNELGISKDTLGGIIKENITKGLKKTSVDRYIEKGDLGEILSVGVDWDSLDNDEIWEVYNKFAFISDFLINKSIRDRGLNSKEATYLLDNGMLIQNWLMGKVMPAHQDKFIGGRALPIEGRGIGGKNIYEFADEYSHKGYSPIELSFDVDDDGNIINGVIGVGTKSAVNTTPGTRTFHNHPDGSFFSNADIEGTVEDKKKAVGLILPGGVVIEFPNNEEFMNLYKLEKDRDFGGLYKVPHTDITMHHTGRSVSIAYSIAKKMGIVDNQKRGVFEDAIKKGGDKHEIKEIGDDIHRKIYEIQRDILEPNRDGVFKYRLASQSTVTTNSGLTEEDVIRGILKKYEESVGKLIKDGTLTPKKAQDLKQQAMHALVTAGNDLLLTRYGDVLTSADREAILGMGYNLKLATNKEELESLKQANAQILGTFKARQAELVSTYNEVFSNSEELDKRLREAGKIYTVRDGKQMVVDVYDELGQAINSIPEGAGEVTQLKQLDRGSLRELNPTQAYILVKTIDLIKNNYARGNIYSQLMYKINPQLRNAVNGLDFFKSFAAVDVGGSWVPKALSHNATENYVKAGEKVMDNSDLTYKANVLKEIYNGYIRRGVTLSMENLEAIVTKELKGTVDEGYAQHYIDAFEPYTDLVGLSPEVKTYINDVLNVESTQIRNALEDAGASMDGILNNTITLDDGSTVALRDIINGNIDGWQERLFGGLSKGSQGELLPEIYKPNNSDVRQAMKGAYARFNDVAYISDNESKAVTQIFGNARKILQRDTNTNRFVDFDYAVGGQNDILKGLMEWHIFGGLKYSDDDSWIQKKTKTMAKTVMHGLGTWGFNKQMWEDVKQIYEVYYAKTLAELNNIQVPNDGAHQVALELAKYFKLLESKLGSKDGATGVSRSFNVNRTFGNLGRIVRRVNSKEGVFSLMNKIGDNQVLGLFKFMSEKDAKDGGVEFFRNLAIGKQMKDESLSYSLLGGYREYIQGDIKEMTRQFNSIFDSDFTDGQVNIIVQGLGGYNITNNWASKWINRALGFISATSTPARMLMAYPGQLFTIYPQLFAYNVKSDAFKKALGIENLKDIDSVRQAYGILEGTYVEWNPIEDTLEGIRNIPGLTRRAGNELGQMVNKIFNMEADGVHEVGANLDDGLLGLYGKTTDYVATKYSTPQKIAVFDAIKDNGNNIIDAVNSKTFKNMAFLKALQKNDYITFMNPEAFKLFMDDDTIAREVKDKLLDRINTYSNRIFQDMLGTGFTGLDRAYGAGAITEFLVGLHQALNFRGAWGLNIFRQTFEKIGTALKAGYQSFIKGNKEAGEEMWNYILRSPEFSNLTECLWSDLVWMWKMGKYAKNGKLPDDESEVDMMDFAEWVTDNIDFVSQQWQGIQSFGWARPYTTAVKAMWDGRNDENLGVGWIGAGAFVNALANNLGRGWKPVNFMFDALNIGLTQGADAGWDYLRSQFYTLSFGTMRYQLEEQWNAYGASNTLTTEKGGIPSVIRGEQYEGSDTAYSYKVRQLQTSLYLREFWDRDEGEYARSELMSSLINQSKFFKALYNIASSATAVGAGILGADTPEWALMNKGVYTLMDVEDDLMTSPTFVKLVNQDKPMPTTAKQKQTLIDRYVNSQYPGGYKAYDGIQNFKNTGHINGQKEGSWYDEGLELFYSKIEKASPGELQKFMNVYASRFLGDASSEEGRRFAYVWAEGWLDKFTDDPNYNLFASALYKGSLNNLYYAELDNLANRISNERKARGFSSSQAKVSRTDINNMDDLKEMFNTQFILNHYDDMYKADSELMQNQIYQWIADELDPELQKKYFKEQNVTNYAGNETGETEWVLSNNIKSQVKDLIFVEKAIEDGRWEDAITRTSSMIQSYAWEDEDGLIRTSIVDYYTKRITESDWPINVKLSALEWLIDKNEEVFKEDSALAEKYGDWYTVAQGLKDETLYGVGMSVVDLLNDYAIALSQDEAGKLENKKTAARGINLSSKINSLRGGLANKAETSNDGNIKSAYATKFVPVPIKGLTAMGYKPATKPKDFDFEAVYKAVGYDPKTKTLGPKVSSSTSKNRAIKSKRKTAKEVKNAVL